MRRMRSTLGPAGRTRREGHVDLHFLVELAENHDHPIKRETAKLGVVNAREFRMGYTGELLRIAR